MENNKTIKLQNGNMSFYSESKGIFPFSGQPMMSIDKDDECASFFIEFASNEEIDAVIDMLNQIKYKNNGC